MYYEYGVSTALVIICEIHKQNIVLIHIKNIFLTNTPKLLDRLPEWIGHLFLLFVEWSLKRKIAKIKKAAFSRPFLKFQYANDAKPSKIYF